jgi:GNAT superfamily N-acetyltransferase
MRKRLTEDDLRAIYRGLVADGALEPLELDGADERAWMDCDLASVAENRIGDATDPRALTAERREHWVGHALTERPFSPRERSFETCFWLLEGGERVGTVALSNAVVGGVRVRLSSLYVFPTLRGRGVGTRALLSLREHFAPHELGIRLDTSWSWQRTVRFYLRRGLWVHMWKHDLALKWDARVPPPLIEIDERSASLAVAIDGRAVVLARAARDGDTLIWDEDVAGRPRDERLEALAWDAEPTLSLALALRGWPLIRSAELWERHRYADGGPPEALAYKIAIWEASDREHGFRVDTPKIPGLEYPTWSELEARWSEASGAFQAEAEADG